ncbi:hypothetical protein LTR49_025164, partial [Elasticomyces elasticus]
VAACTESIATTCGNNIALGVPTSDVVVGLQMLKLGAVSTIDGETLSLLPGNSQLVTVSDMHTSTLDFVTTAKATATLGQTTVTVETTHSACGSIAD